MFLKSKELSVPAFSLNNIQEGSLDFKELVELLVTHNDKVKAIDVMIPEIIIFNNGRPKCVVKYDKRQKELKALVGKTMLEFPKLLKLLLDAYDSRRKPIITHKSLQSRLMKVIQRNIFKISECLMVNIKYINTTNLLMLTQKELINLMNERPGSKIWKQISYIKIMCQFLLSCRKISYIDMQIGRAHV